MSIVSNLVESGRGEVGFLNVIGEISRSIGEYFRSRLSLDYPGDPYFRSGVFTAGLQAKRLTLFLIDLEISSNSA